MIGVLSEKAEASGGSSPGANLSLGSNLHLTEPRLGASVCEHWWGVAHVQTHLLFQFALRHLIPVVLGVWFIV